MKSELKQALEQLLICVQSAGEHHWAQKLDELLRADPNDEASAREIKSWYGGMGSLADLILSEYDGELLVDDEFTQCNQRFVKLRSALYQEAYNIR